MQNSKRALRSHFRAVRQRLAPSTQQSNADAITRHFVRSNLRLRYQRYTAYLAADGELDPLPLVHTLWQHAAQVALPCLRRNGQPTGTLSARLDMHFAGFDAYTPLTTGHYNLTEPVAPTRPPPFNPQVLLMPLVAFDDSGIRLGMGGGFYDRFSAQPRNKKALRIGLAHSAQHAPHALPKETWDQPLDAVITEQGIKAFTTRARARLANLSGAPHVH